MWQGAHCQDFLLDKYDEKIIKDIANEFYKRLPKKLKRHQLPFYAVAMNQIKLPGILNDPAYNSRYKIELETPEE